ncbi:MAG: GatB/YqeY domain-containing protein [Eubacteriaceae bacterium]|jgi:uncharacterized protein YqeY|nr:GatB/YqeY domain-containing protein [Eubacteriaceae bacterium]
MDLKEQLKNQLVEAMREKNTVKKNVVTLLRAAVLQIEKDTKTELGDEEILAIVAKQLKQRRDSLEAFERASRADLIEQTNQEIALLSAYLPKQLTDEELRKIAKEAISETGATSPKELGRVMAALMPKIQGKSDGKRASAVAKAILEEA